MTPVSRRNNYFDIQFSQETSVLRPGCLTKGYGSGVWIVGMDQGMDRGYGSRPGKHSDQHWPGIGP